MQIKIYDQEVADGVAEQVQASASIAYYAEPVVHLGSLQAAQACVDNQSVLDKLLAENQNQHDLHYLEAVLVSTGMNKNDDVFTAEATWAARHTPEDKQFNFMHDENDIIGHITGSYVLSQDGKVAGDERPEKFDIITQAVLYNSWTGEDNQQRMQEIIAEIEEGKWYVSMECLFAGFDYAVVEADGATKILARDESSAFLTKHLRAYGGTGEYEGKKIGRALSNISFSGKGLVSKPANPRSVILSKASATLSDKNSLNLNSISLGESNMAQSLEKQVEELKAERAAALAENEKIKTQISEAKDREFASQVEAFQAAADEASAKIEALNEAIKSTEARVAELEDALATSAEQLTAAKEEVKAMQEQEKAKKREAALVEAGLDEDEVAESLASLAGLDDAAFDSVVALYKKKAKFVPFGKDKDKDKDKDKKDDKKSDATEASTEAQTTEPEDPTAETFDGVETSEAAIVVSTPEDERETTRASISDWFESQVLNK